MADSTGTTGTTDPNKQKNPNKADVAFKVEFIGANGKTPSLNYDEDQNSFSLMDGPLDIGTLEDLGTSIASFFGGHFPNTENIPVIGTVMNQLDFRINKFHYVGSTDTEWDSFNLNIDMIPGEAMKIGAASVHDIDINISQSATKKATTS